MPEILTTPASQYQEVGLTAGPDKKIAIFIVAYNAVATLARVLDRIPAEVKKRVAEIFIFDDASQDDTSLVAEGWKKVSGFEKLTIFRNAVNQGYGGNQKLGYEYAAKKGYDIVVLLHGDGQYAPEVMPELLKPLLEDKADAVFGSRMLVPGGARKGGMPLYKYVGNRILTKFENWSMGANLSEWHSGYRAYSVKALAQLPLKENTNDFHFDSEIIIQLLDRGFRIAEVPIPTYYGDEICYVNGLKYAGNLFRVVYQYKAHKAGWRSYPKFASPADRDYELKRSPWSSHAMVQRAVPPGCRVLDLGCEANVVRGFLERGCRVTGVNDHSIGIAGMEAFYVHDLEQPLPIPPSEKYDRIVLADVLEHIRSAPRLLAEVRERLAPGGRAILSTGNVAVWMMRLALATGRFNYGRRGILDETHVRLYTLNTFLELIRNAGLRPVRIQATPIPLELLFPRHASSWWVRGPTQLYAFLANAWKRMFAFQFVVEVAPALEAKPTVITISSVSAIAKAPPAE